MSKYLYRLKTVHSILRREFDADLSEWDGSWGRPADWDSKAMVWRRRGAMSLGARTATQVHQIYCDTANKDPNLLIAQVPPLFQTIRAYLELFADGDAYVDFDSEAVSNAGTLPSFPPLAEGEWQVLKSHGRAPDSPLYRLNWKTDPNGRLHLQKAYENHLFQCSFTERHLKRLGHEYERADGDLFVVSGETLFDLLCRGTTCR